MNRRPIVAIVGRPNVGKSTLYNRILGVRAAIVHDRPGITRDLRYGDTDHAGRELTIVDTGGLDAEIARNDQGSLGAAIHRMAIRAVDEAAVCVLVTDAEVGVTPTDEEVARDLRRRGKRILFVANKVDGAKREGWEADVYALGTDRVFGVSASHGRGVMELLDGIVEALGEAAPQVAAPLHGDERETADHNAEGQDAVVGPIRVAIVGKPNAGKSSLINRLLGDQRVVVHDTAGTTMDAVDLPFESGGRDYVLIDTAGIRRGRSVDDVPEKVAVEKAHDAIGRADVAVLAIDALEGPSEQDARIAGYAEEKGRAVVIALTKWDLVREKTARATPAAPAEPDPARRLRQRIQDELPHVDWAPVVITSARAGRGIDDLLAAVAGAHAEYNRRIPTAALNRFFEQIIEHHPPPSEKGRRAKLLYITQPSIRPPTFVVVTSAPELVGFAWRRYLMNQIRGTFGYRGTPLRIVCKRRPGGARQR